MPTFFCCCMVADFQCACVPLFSFTRLCFFNAVVDLFNFVRQQVVTVATLCMELYEDELFWMSHLMAILLCQIQ